MATDVFDDTGQPVVGAAWRTGLHRAVPFACRWAFSVMRMARATARPISSAFPGSGITVTTRCARESGGFVILGRSDAVLNPGGVRIGTAEIYRQVETVAGSPGVTGHRPAAWRRRARGAVRPAARGACCSTRARSSASAQAIREGASPRHVPARIVAVADLPRTLSGKLVEARRARCGAWALPVSNRDALANPESLELFRNLPQLAD